MDTTTWDQIIARQRGTIEFARKQGWKWLEVLATDTLRCAEERKAGNHAARTIPFNELMRLHRVKR